ncbi:alanine/glycine:cation symporter family protein [Acidaminobacter hydrogenoformans]|uniref:Alanine or glycine:cation symporter, AGCS family n=1 Tax=Acidaminobacter hydrogenoformans DSM 2784 TaxID=1120920 RepID=A0A1G5S5H0_9FIRM|nr:sodium:alanine symporter family protein [Acidaminobacter hydrogenoformans]SCZ81575.1 alanine or glycine:cation symporter, AGCS family [Acidaminobacter hydrogenoformans DSM 2784]
MEKITQINDFLNGLVWGPYMIGLILFTGVLLTVRLGFPQVVNFKYIIKNTLGRMFKKPEAGEGDISSGQAGLTAIAAVVGTGNIAGVATAIAMGGPGAVFWMWVSAFFGMATKFSEIALGIKYRERRKDGTYSGGAMYYLDKGLNSKFMAVFFSVMVIITYFIIGAIVDTNSMVLSLEEQWGIEPLISGIVLAVLAGIVILGGIKRMGQVCEILAPFMGGLYILAGIAILLLNITEVPAAILTIIKSAFNPVAATGGFAGSAIATTIRMGFARGMFSNEAGMGSSPIIHSSARVNHPVEQGIWGVAEVFVDTMLICSITGIAIVLSGEWMTGISGPALTMRAFDSTLPGNVGSYIVMGSAVLFGYSCLISANFYCERAGEYLFGPKAILPIRLLWIVFIVIGSIGGLEFVWALADTANGLMAIPNLIGLILLSSTVVSLKKDYFNSEEKNRINKVG